MKENPYLIYFVNICIQKHLCAPFKSLQSQTPSPTFVNIIMGPNAAIESRWSTIGILQMQLPVCIDLYCMLLQLRMWHGIKRILIVRTIEDQIYWSYILGRASSWINCSLPDVSIFGLGLTAPVNMGTSHPGKHNHCWYFIITTIMMLMTIMTMMTTMMIVKRWIGSPWQYNSNQQLSLPSCRSQRSCRQLASMTSTIFNIHQYICI